MQNFQITTLNFHLKRIDWIIVFSNRSLKSQQRNFLKTKYIFLKMDAELRSRRQEERLQRELEVKFSILDKQKRVVFEGMNREQQKWRRHFLRYQLQIEMNAVSKPGDSKGKELFRQLSKLSRNLSQKAEHEVVAFLKKLRGLDGTQHLKRSQVLGIAKDPLIYQKTGSSSSLDPSLCVLKRIEAERNLERKSHHRSDFWNDLNQSESHDLVISRMNRDKPHVILGDCESEGLNISTELLTPKNDVTMEKQLSPADASLAERNELSRQVLSPPLFPQSTTPHLLPHLISPRSRLTHSTPENNIVLATQEFRKIRSRDKLN